MKKVNNSKNNRRSRSFESMAVTLSGIPQRQASTPTHERTTMSASPDISAIVVKINKSDTPKRQTKNAGRQPTIKNISQASSEEINLAHELDYQYTQNLQVLFRRKLEERKCKEIDDELTKLQKRLSENQKILSDTSNGLKNIQFNKEVDLLHSLHSPNYGRILETLDKENCEEQLTILNQRLELARHQLRVKKVEVMPADQLSQVIAETVTAYEKLKADLQLETAQALIEISKVKKSTSNNLLKTVKSLPVNEELLLRRTALEISARHLEAQSQMNESMKDENQENQDIIAENVEIESPPDFQSYSLPSPTDSEINEIFNKS